MIFPFNKKPKVSLNPILIDRIRYLPPLPRRRRRHHTLTLHPHPPRRTRLTIRNRLILQHRRRRNHTNHIILLLLLMRRQLNRCHPTTVTQVVIALFFDPLALPDVPYMISLLVFYVGVLSLCVGVHSHGFVYRVLLSGLDLNRVYG